MTSEILTRVVEIMQDYGNGPDGLNEVGQRSALAQALSNAGLLAGPEHDAQVEARALREAVSGGAVDAATYLWLHERADRIEREAEGSDQP